MEQNTGKLDITVQRSLEGNLVDYARSLAKIQPFEFVEPLMDGVYPYPPLVLGEDHPLSYAEIKKYYLEDAFLVVHQCIKYSFRIEKLAQLKQQLDGHMESIKLTFFTKDDLAQIIRHDLEMRLSNCEGYIEEMPISNAVFGSEFFDNILSMRSSVEALRNSLAGVVGVDFYQKRFDVLDENLKQNKRVDWKLSPKNCEGQLENMAPLKRWWWFEDNYRTTSIEIE